MKFAAFLVVFSSLLIGSVSQADIMLSPGDTLIRNGEHISCGSGGGLPAVTANLCNCNYNGSTYGQAVVFSGQSATTECKTIYNGSTPFSCKPLASANVTCNCNYNASTYGQVLLSPGLSGAAECKNVYNGSTPTGCVAQ